MPKYAVLLALLSIPLPALLQHEELVSMADDHHDENTTPPHGKCKKITIPFCMDLPWNMTIMPNLLGHANLDEAGLEVHQYFPLVKVNCSPDLQMFLCSVYFPVCTILDEPVPPCRSMCLSAREGCLKIMQDFGFNWPDNIDCKQYPDSSKLCVAKDSIAISNRSAESAESKRHRPKTGVARDYGFVCPVQFKLNSVDYSIRVGETVQRSCGAPCHLMFFDEHKQRISRVWVGTWAIICSISCLFTVCTFLIDTDRFRYPERPIIFLAVCYLMVAAAYVVGFMAGDSIACREPINGGDGIRRVSMITQGTKYELCTILFMVLYFFSMASSIWWVVLTLTWFLAAGLKWGHEAIEANSQYFHLAAWAIPAIKTITILAMGKVDGDVLSGVCYVGIWNIESLRIFILIPLCIYLVFGLIFLTSGLISLFRIRTVMKHDGTKTDKLEKLMIRIGVFSILYTVPAVIVITCLFYEHFYFDDWMLSWNQDLCKKRTIYSVPCPQEVRNYSHPHFEVFMIKYLMYMIVGITSSVWIWSGKTVHSWKVFLNRFKGRRAAYV